MPIIGFFAYTIFALHIPLVTMPVVAAISFFAHTIFALHIRLVTMPVVAAIGVFAYTIFAPNIAAFLPTLSLLWEFSLHRCVLLYQRRDLLRVVCSTRTDDGVRHDELMTVCAMMN